MHISRSKYFFHVCREAALLGLYTSTLVHFNSESLGDVALTADKSCGDKAKLARENLLAALDLLWYLSSACRVGNEFQLDSLYSRKSALFVLDELLYGGVVDTWIVTENSYSLLLTVVSLANSRILRERIVLTSLIGELRHHFKLCD